MLIQFRFYFKNKRIGRVDHMELKIKWNLRKNVLCWSCPLLNQSVYPWDTHSEEKKELRFIFKCVFKKLVVMLIALFCVKSVSFWYLLVWLWSCQYYSLSRGWYPSVISVYFRWSQVMKGEEYLTLISCFPLIFSAHPTFSFFTCQQWKKTYFYYFTKWQMISFLITSEKFYICWR